MRRKESTAVVSFVILVYQNNYNNMHKHQMESLFVYMVIQPTPYESIYKLLFMVAEMLQKYIFVLNIFLPKKLCVFIFNKKIFLFCKHLSFKEIYFYSIKIYLCSKNFYIQPVFFILRIYLYSKKKKNFFYSMIF